MDMQSEEIEALRTDLAALDRVRLRIYDKLERLQAITQASRDAAQGATTGVASMIDFWSRVFPPRPPTKGAA